MLKALTLNLRERIFAVLCAVLCAAVSCAPLVASAPAYAQTSTPTLPPAIQQCVNWMQTTATAPTSIHPVLFCSVFPSGQEQVGGWGSILRSCSSTNRETTKLRPDKQYCASAGFIKWGDTLALSYRGAPEDVADLAASSSSDHIYDEGVIAELYTRTPAWIGRLRIPAGMFRLIPDLQNGRSILEVFSESDSLNAGVVLRPIGTIQLESTYLQFPRYQGSAFELSAAGRDCPPTQQAQWQSELQLLHHNQDLYACIQPDEVAPTPPETSRTEIPAGAPQSLY